MENIYGNHEILKMWGVETYVKDILQIYSHNCYSETKNKKSNEVVERETTIKDDYIYV